MVRLLRRMLLVVVGLAIVAAIAWALKPPPVPVDLAEASSGRLLVTANDDGRTRIKERYLISAPLAGRLVRIELDPGDDAHGSETILAAIQPVDPALLDARARAEAGARVKASEASVRRAERDLERLGKVLERAEQDLEHFRTARDRGAATWKELEDAELFVQICGRERDASHSACEVARYELELSKAAFLRTQPPDDGEADATHFEIRAPCDGRVLRVFQRSEGVVTAGMPLLEFGDPTDLEIVVDVLSADAVRIQPGAEVILDGWGGAEPLRGRVRVVEPSAFTKVSALGVEEQRVNVIIDLTDPPDQRATLGDGFRVDARIVLWEADDVVKVPTSALFRDDDVWAVFRIVTERAVLQHVEIGQRNDLEAEVLAGLDPGDRVIAHPSDRVEDGVRVVER